MDNSSSTGAKHYGFHIGPATSPSFESDPRITLENNFYYPCAPCFPRLTLIIRTFPTPHH